MLKHPDYFQALNSKATQANYLISLLSLLLFIWIATLSWFHFYLDIFFFLPQVITLLVLMFITLLIFQYPPGKLAAIRPKRWSENTTLFVLLGWVLILNSGLLYFTGGSVNPLILILFMPVILAMLVLSKTYFFSLAALAVLLYISLNYFYVPIMSLKVQSLEAFFAWHIHGTMLVFMALVLLLTLVIWPLKTRLEEQNKLLAQKKNQALQEEYFLATASLAAASVHKLSTPLNSLQILNDLLGDEVKTSAGQDYLQTAGEQIQVCIESLQALRQRADQSVDKGLTPLSMGDFVAQLREEFALLHPKSELITHVDTNQALIYSDATLKLALLNLCDNAARYSPNYIRLKATLEHNHWVFIIEDQGGGVTEEELLNLGNGFADESHGMGMGVFISRMIIERFAGHLQFENMTHQAIKESSDKESIKGLRVIVTLPLPDETNVILKETDL